MKRYLGKESNTIVMQSRNDYLESKLLYSFFHNRSCMVLRISFQATHEQGNPSELLHDVTHMDQKGIERCWTSDHYMPWWHTGASGGMVNHRSCITAV